MKKQLQLLIFLLGISFHFSFSQCSAPTSVSVSAITPNTIVVDWNQTEVNNVSWTLTIRESADIATIYTNLSSRKPYLVTDLYCNTSYDLFVTSYCNGVQSAPSETIVFQTASCIPDQFSFPIDLNACINETGTSCFNLNSNNVNLLSGTNPSNYIITYHETLTNARYVNSLNNSSIEFHPHKKLNFLLNPSNLLKRKHSTLCHFPIFVFN